jgi:tRNA (cytidine/uridine-2'-O-)-methyltransferase
VNIVLYRPEIAANVGAIGRTCVAAGAKLWLVRPLGFLLSDRHRRRAGLDYWSMLDWAAVDDLDEVIQAPGIGRCWFFSCRAERSYSEVAYQRNDALVFGPESRGLPERILIEHADHALRIPIRPEARSLNLASAVAIALFEALRQVGTHGAQAP